MHSTLADSAVSFFAMMGLLTVSLSLRLKQGGDGLTSRVVFAARLLAALMAARILSWSFDAWIWNSLTLVLAAWVPLTALVVMEGLIRRHAPRRLKLAMVAGGLVFTLTGATGMAGFVIPLLCFQFTGLFAVAWLAAARDRSSLSKAENAVVARIAFSLPFVLLLLASDFGLLESFVPVRISGIAVLVLCWTTLGEGAGGGSRRQALAALVAVTVSAFLLVLVVYDALRGAILGRRSGIVAALAGCRAATVPEMMAEVSRRSDLDARIIGDDIMSGYDRDRLVEAFPSSGVLSAEAASRAEDLDARQQIESLLATYDATHLLLVRTVPPRIAAVVVPSVGLERGIDTELALLSRMASLLPSGPDHAAA